jgi:chorismate lyase/3-hydroxybenzoate synthase
MMAAVHPLHSPHLAAPLDVGYVWRSSADPAEPLRKPGTLAVIGFGCGPIAVHDDPRFVQVPLQATGTGLRPLEIWNVDDAIACGRNGDLSWSMGGGYLMVALRVSEDDHGGIHDAAAYAYRRLLEALALHDHPHLLRAWNYLADINAGDGDNERYRHFSIGRAEGMAGLNSLAYPAATAIGRVDGIRELVVYALAAKVAGQPVENPRQVSAYRYPRQYGPVSPSFARAMRLDMASPALLISGTASVVGHASRHDRADAQIAETIRNLDSLIGAAGMGACLPVTTLLKAYVRNRGDDAVVRPAVEQRGLAAERLICLEGDICRSELLLEIDGVSFAHG